MRRGRPWARGEDAGGDAGGRRGARRGRGEVGRAPPTPPRAQTLTPLALGEISTVLSILLPPPPLGSGVPVATRGASLATAGAQGAAPKG